jgi:hypothetical protein
MSVAAIAAAHVVMSNSRSIYGSGGGGGNNDDDGYMWFLGFLGTILLGLVCFLAYIIFLACHDEKLPPYLVNGTLQSYETRQDGKWKKVFVNLLQPDGVIRRYPTSYRPGECYHHAPGVSVPVEVQPTYNTWTKKTRYSTQLVVDACRR